MKKMTILCSSLIFVGLCVVAACSSNAVEAPDITRIETTTCVEPTTLYTTRMTTTPMTTKCTTSCTTTTPVTTTTCTTTTTVATTTTEVTTVTETEATHEYIVYKPSTKYVHRSTCRWNNADAYPITDTNDILARYCTECNADIEIKNLYIPPEPVTEVIEVVEVVQETETEYNPTPEPIAMKYCDDSDRYYLAVMLSHECSPRASVEHNATAVACMFNRVRDGWASSIYDAIQTGCVPWWGGGSLSSYGLYGDTSYCYDAIDYYLSHSDEYSWQHSWEASGDDVHNSYS